MARIPAPPKKPTFISFRVESDLLAAIDSERERIAAVVGAEIDRTTFVRGVLRRALLPKTAPTTATTTKQTPAKKTAPARRTR